MTTHMVLFSTYTWTMTSIMPWLSKCMIHGLISHVIGIACNIN